MAQIIVTIAGARSNGRGWRVKTNVWLLVDVYCFWKTKNTFKRRRLPNPRWSDPLASEVVADPRDFIFGYYYFSGVHWPRLRSLVVNRRACSTDSQLGSGLYNVRRLRSSFRFTANASPGRCRALNCALRTEQGLSVGSGIPVWNSHRILLDNHSPVASRRSKDARRLDNFCVIQSDWLDRLSWT